MVIRGGTRGNGKQLGEYLTTMKENERIQILEVDGREYSDEEHLHSTVQSMSLMAELTKSKKGLYHAQINPAYNEDKNMDWFKAADMLGAELGFEGQRRVIVLHQKKGRTHAHVVWERYDYDAGIMKSDSFSRLAQDRARKAMELEFGHTITPHRNKHRPELKASLTSLWKQTGTGAQFLNACKNNNYMIAQGVGRSQFIVVDEHGRSFDLVRQLKDVRLKDVRQRLRNETLMTEKAAIVYMRNKNSERDTGGDSGKQKTVFKPSVKAAINQFVENQQAFENENQPANGDQTFAANKQDLVFTNEDEKRTTRQNSQTVSDEFADNKKATDKPLSEKEQRIRQMAKEMTEERNRQRQREREQGLDYD